jgi:hypothetical protein
MSWGIGPAHSHRKARPALRFSSKPKARNLAILLRLPRTVPEGPEHGREMLGGFPLIKGGQAGHLAKTLQKVLLGGRLFPD